MRKKSANPTLRMWGTRTLDEMEERGKEEADVHKRHKIPILGCGERTGVEEKKPVYRPSALTTYRRTSSRACTPRRIWRTRAFANVDIT